MYERKVKMNESNGRMVISHDPDVFGYEYIVSVNYRPDGNTPWVGVDSQKMHIAESGSGRGDEAKAWCLDIETADAAIRANEAALELEIKT